jgi:glycerophosphoryl diester phosphodiesterase
MALMPLALRILTVAVLLAMVGYLVGWALANARPDHPYVASFPAGAVMVHAHQGGDHVWPGNTMLAFREAHALGVDVLELDVHLSVDGRVIVLHDATVDRTSDGVGRVSEMTLAEVQAFDAAYRWRPPGAAADAFPHRGSGLTIPTLDEVLEAFPGRALNVELKAPDARLAREVCALVRGRGAAASVLVASFHQATLRDFRSACPEVATSAGPDEVRNFFVLNTLFLGRLATPEAEAFQVPVRQGAITLVTPRFARGLRERNVLLDVWTINDPAEMRRLVDLGVRGLITDRPDLAMALLGR